MICPVNRSRSLQKYCNFSGDDHELAEYLINKGANISEPNMVGETPLHYAARSGNLKRSGFFFRN